jgi:hypothetical protein
MAINRGKRISELTELTSASLNTTIVGVDNGTTYKIELDTLADAVTARVNTLDRERLQSLESVTSSFETKGRSVVSGSSQLTSSFDQRYVASGSITQTTWDNIANKPAGIVSQSTDLSSLNAFTASISTASLVNRLNTIESVSGSWITESETGSFLTNLNGAISSSSQLTSSFDARYTLSGSVQNIELPSNLVSGSSQLTSSLDGRYLQSGSSPSSDSITFNRTAGINVTEGQMAWNNSDGTLDIGLNYGDVVLQVGQEQHYVVRNSTGTTIPNGTAVYASGVSVGSKRIEVSPFTANGTTDEIRFLGLATHNILDGVNGIVSNFGYVRGLDTRGTSATAISVGDETWAEGDILYAHPTVAGKLTKVAPKDKITVAMITTRHQTTGVLFVRPSSFGHIDDLHDVQINTNNLVTGSMLEWNGGYFVNNNTFSSSVDTRLDTLETSIITGSVNYVQVLGNRRTGITTTGVSIISGSITTTGNPVQIMVTGDANPVNVSSWTRLQIYRNETAIGNIVQVENSSNLNVPYCVNVIDTASAGTYTYSMRTVSGISGLFDFGESTGPTLTIVELNTNTNLPSTNNTFTGTNRFNGQVTLGGAGGDEGGELQLATAQTNSTLTAGVVSVDVYRDRLRIFEGGGNSRGVYIDLSKAPAGNAGELMWKSSGMVNAGTFVSLDNIKATVTSGSPYGLSIAAVSTTFSANISAYHAYTGGIAGGQANNQSITTTPTNSLFNWSFITEGDGAYYTIVDKTNNRMYRITMMIGSGFNNNFISIERLF